MNSNHIKRKPHVLYYDVYMKYILEQIIGILFPEHCIGCSRYNTPLCEKCMNTIPTAHTTEVLNTYSLFSYKHPYVRDGIWAMKYKNTKTYARVFGKRLCEMIEADILEKDNFISSYIIIPVPISKEKRKTRGYNQTEWLTESILLYMNKELSRKIIHRKDILKRYHRETTQARTSDRMHRLEQIEGAFYIEKSKQATLKNKHILLIDDVTTTGGTIKEIQKILHAAHVASVTAYTIGH